MHLTDPELADVIPLRQAYLAMFEFLLRHWERGPADVAFVLSQLQLLSDQGSADPATMIDWLDAVNTLKRAEATSGGYRAADVRLTQ